MLIRIQRWAGVSVTLGLAAENLAEARQQNPNAMITVTEGKQEKTLTLDQISALAHLYEARYSEGKCHA